MPAAIVAIAGAIVFLQKKFKVFTKIANFFKGIKQKIDPTIIFGPAPIKGADNSLNKGPESSPGSTSSVDVSGSIQVAAAQGSEVLKTRSLNKNVGLNTVFAGA